MNITTTMNAVAAWVATQTTGYRTYSAAVGLTGLAVYQFSNGDWVGGIQTALAALAAAGLRHRLGVVGDLLDNATKQK